MSTIKDEKVKNRYNAVRKTHPTMDTSSPQDPPTQDMKVQEKEKINPQARKVAPKKDQI